MMLKSKDVTIGSIVMPQSGYFNITEYKPQGMNHFLFAIIWTYGSDSKHGALGVNANGNFVFFYGRRNPNRCHHKVLLLRLI